VHRSLERGERRASRGGATVARKDATGATVGSRGFDERVIVSCSLLRRPTGHDEKKRKKRKNVRQAHAYVGAHRAPRVFSFVLGHLAPATWGRRFASRITDPGVIP
jgi:hypothetical protein